MKESNIYDIDGELIRRGDQGAFTLEETEELVDKLTKKVKENPDNEVYKVYLNNAQKWLFNLYNNMSREDLMKRMSFLQTSVDEAKNTANEAEQKQLEEINKAIEQLKNEYDNLPEGTPVSTPEGTGDEQLDRPVECPVGITSFTDVNSERPMEEPAPVVMDEYVSPIGEASDEYVEEIKDGE